MGSSFFLGFFSKGFKVRVTKALRFGLGGGGLFINPIKIGLGGPKGFGKLLWMG